MTGARGAPEGEHKGRCCRKTPEISCWQWDPQGTAGTGELAEGRQARWSRRCAPPQLSTASKRKNSFFHVLENRRAESLTKQILTDVHIAE